MKKIIIAAALLCVLSQTDAQRIDLNNSQNKTEDGYTGWTFANAVSASTTIDGLTLTLAVEGQTTGRTLKCEWWKDGVNKHSKLVNDGVGVYGLDANNNTPQIQSGEVGMTLTVKGLSAGSHSLLAYHNNPSGFNGPNLDVYVDGTRVLEGVEQTNRAQSASASGQSYVTFTAVEGQDVVITWRTTPDESVDYTQGYNTTSLFVDALVFDEANPKATALDPSPAKGDEHADCDGGKVTLKWTAPEGISSFRVNFGTSASDLSQTFDVQKTEVEVTIPDIFGTYYWRVDAKGTDGNYVKGETWSFRPRRLAFPDAEGYGRFAIGGRGGSVYHVTSLDDDPSDPQPGTFRYGILNVSGPRTIVFDVAGVIHLKSRLTCSDKYVTIAGQTAPGRGIMFRGAPFGMASDGITRFIRMRRGHIVDEADSNKGLDGLGMAGNDQAIMDHCSISWTIDEAFSSRGAKDITLQRTLISEALNVAGHPNYPEGTAHGYAATIGAGQNGGKCGSFHHNLLAHNEGRNWSVSGGLDGSGNYDGHHDIFNNVCYNWGGRATDGGTHELNFVANYYKKGPATTQNFLLNHDFEGTGTGTQRAYVSGNIREELNGTKTADKLDVTYKCTWRPKQTTHWEPWVSEPFFPSFATIHTADEAYQNVLSDVGCNQPELDNHDQRMVSETLSGSATTIGRNCKKRGLIDHEDDSEGYDGLNIIEASRPADWDSDGDGIPDWYEELVGTNPKEANNNADSDGNSYTDLEDYLEFLAVPHFTLKPDEELSIDLKRYFAGFADFTVEGDNGGQSVDGFTYSFVGTTMNVKAVTANTLGSIDVKVTDKTTGVKMTRRFNFAVSDKAPSAISETKADATTAGTGAVYNLQGQQLFAPQRGLNISGGRKFIKR